MTRSVIMRLGSRHRGRLAEGRPIDAELPHSGAKCVGIDRQNFRGAVGAFDATLSGAKGSLDVLAHSNVEGGDCRRAMRRRDIAAAIGHENRRLRRLWRREAEGCRLLLLPPIKVKKMTATRLRHADLVTRVPGADYMVSRSSSCS
jgi:hypothetical protein